MNKTIVLALAGLVVVGAGAYFIFGSGGGSLTNDSVGGGAATLKDLIAKGGSQKCTYEVADATARSSGTVYFSGGKMRGDFVSTELATNKAVESHMIADGEYNYIWTSETEQGMKIKNVDGAAGAPSGGGGFDLDQSYNYDCDSWRPDSSLFETPSGVNFMELNMPSIPTSSTGKIPGSGASGSGGQVEPSGTNDMLSLQCAACSQIGDAEAQAECRQALGCE